MPRELTGHIVNPCNDRLKIEVLDEPGSGEACHRYDITGYSAQNNPGRDVPSPHGYTPNVGHTCILFQQGPIAEAGTNGITHEALLAILIDRLEGFQRGPFACDANLTALCQLKAAQTALLERTRERMVRNVEGTYKP